MPSVLRLGFTGSQHGSQTEYQLEAVRGFLVGTKVGYETAEFHHGVCIGWDEIAAEIAHELGYKLFGHPPTKTNKMSKIVNDFDFPPLPYLERNRRIVDSTAYLLSASRTPYELVRSGTWSTIRFAVRRNKPGVVIYPSGKIVQIAEATSISREVSREVPH